MNTLSRGRRAFLFLTATLFATATATAGEETEAVRITDGNILFFYESHADLPSPGETVAKAYSQEYREANNEFTKADLLKKLLPVVERKIAEARETEEVMLRLRWEVPAYDFTKEGFPTGLSSSDFVPFSSGGQEYAVGYKGTKSFVFLPLPRATAAMFEKKLSHSRSGYLEIFGKIVSAEETSIGGYPRKVVYLKPARITFSLADGSPLGELPVPQPATNK